MRLLCVSIFHFLNIQQKSPGDVTNIAVRCYTYRLLEFDDGLGGSFAEIVIALQRVANFIEDVFQRDHRIAAGSLDEMFHGAEGWSP